LQSPPRQSPEALTLPVTSSLADGEAVPTPTLPFVTTSVEVPLPELRMSFDEADSVRRITSPAALPVAHSPGCEATPSEPSAAVRPSWKAVH
jgi:hypothetical protein